MFQILCSKSGSAPIEPPVVELVFQQHEDQAALAELTFPYTHKPLPYCEILSKNELIFRGTLVGEIETLSTKGLVRATYRTPVGPIPSVDHLPYDPLFFDEPHLAQYREAAPYVLNIDRVTGQINLSHMHEGRHHYRLLHILSLQTRLLHTPIAHIHLSVEAVWTQQFEALFDLMPSIERVCPKGEIQTLIPSSLLSQWPQKGPFLVAEKGRRNGYTVIEAQLSETTSSSLMIHDKPYTVSTLSGELLVNAHYVQPRAEYARTTISRSDTEGGHIDMRFRMSPLDHPTGPAMQTHETSFFSTERGKRALLYAMRLATQHLNAANRCMETILTVPAHELPHITLDTTAEWIDRENKACSGKIAGYRLEQRYGHSLLQIRVLQSQGEPLPPPQDIQLLAEEGPKGLSSRHNTWVQHIEIENNAEQQISDLSSDASIKAPRPTRLFIRLTPLGTSTPLVSHQRFEGI